MENKERKTEDEMSRDHLGPQGVPGKPDQGKITPQKEENIPKNDEFDGYVA